MADQYYRGWDEALDCEYRVSVTPFNEEYYNDDTTKVHEVYIEVKYDFFVSSGAKKGRIPEASSGDGGRWYLQDLPGGLFELRQEVILLLDGVGIPLSVRNKTISLIFESNILPTYQRRSRVRDVVGVFLETKTVPDEPESEEEEEPMEEDEDDIIEDEDGVETEENEDGGEGDDGIGRHYEDEEDEDAEFDRVVRTSMEEEDSWRPTPARREAVEGLEMVRIRGGEREACCSVCLMEYSVGTEVAKMPCSHVFHRDCLVKWLDSRCFCPLCKFELSSSAEEEVILID